MTQIPSQPQLVRFWIKRCVDTIGKTKYRVRVIQGQSVRSLFNLEKKAWKKNKRKKLLLFQEQRSFLLNSENLTQAASSPLPLSHAASDNRCFSPGISQFLVWYFSVSLLLIFFR